MTELRTNKALLKALEKSSSRNPPPQQLERQRLSFVIGALPEANDMTREEIQGVLEQQEGRPLKLG